LCEPLATPEGQSCFLTEGKKRTEQKVAKETKGMGVAFERAGFVVVCGRKQKASRRRPRTFVYRTIPKRQSRLPFVTFACFCSNIFACFCPPSKDQACRTSHAQTEICRRTIPERQSRLPFVTFASFCPPPKTKPAERHTLKRKFVEGPSRNASPVYPLLPLLASVQILFASFCPPSKTKPAERHTLKRKFVEGPIPERQSRLPFVTFACFGSNSLCFLLSAVKPRLTSK
jgi:hypothetical protein